MNAVTFFKSINKYDEIVEKYRESSYDNFKLSCIGNIIYETDSIKCDLRYHEEHTYIMQIYDYQDYIIIYTYHTNERSCVYECNKYYKADIDDFLNECFIIIDKDTFTVDELRTLTNKLDIDETIVGCELLEHILPLINFTVEDKYKIIKEYSINDFYILVAIFDEQEYIEWCRMKYHEISKKI